MNILITGCAGFVGFHVAKKLLNNKNNRIVGIDSINNYYKKKLKLDRLNILKNNSNFFFVRINLINFKKTEAVFKKYNIDVVIHLAAQAGVRYSLINPKSYLNNNIISFFNIIEISKNYRIKHFLFASTSSVYGDSKKLPLNENFNTDRPLSFYAATKKSNEVMAYSYSSISKLACTGLRLFTVYGPMGRPDMALFKFSKDILNNKEIKIFNYGKHSRDFTYITDIVEFITRLVNKPSKLNIPYSIFNLGNGRSRKLKDYINIVEKNLSKKAICKNIKLQKGDALKTHADISKVSKITNYRPKITIEKGISNFIKWYREYYSC
jgi:UDP-glucuronate 4-epimerase